MSDEETETGRRLSAGPSSFSSLIAHPSFLCQIASTAASYPFPSAIDSYRRSITSALPSRNRQRESPTERHSTSITASGAAAIRPKKSANMPVLR